MMASSVYVSDKTVVEVEPYAARRTLLRLDVGPFVLLYSAVYCTYSFSLFSYQPEGERESTRDTSDGASEVAVMVLLPVVLLLHLLVFLFTQWSVKFFCLVSQRRVNSVDIAESVRVVPAKHCGSEELVSLHRRLGTGAGVTVDSSPFVTAATSVKVAGQAFTLPDLWFVFQQTKFVYGDVGSKKGFVRLEYPSEGPFQSFLHCRGLRNEKALAMAMERWGLNVLDIPMPAFNELFAEHAVAPFFVFQMLCVALWSLDDYWYYALFTLAMLVLFEAMLCVQRQRNLEMLRSMRREPGLVYTLRGGRWRRASSETVTPGEVVSLVARPPTFAAAMRAAQRRVGGGMQRHHGVPGKRGGGTGSMGMDVLAGRRKGSAGREIGVADGDEETLAPFDVLLMRGSCVVNEAMLTGESVPQAKTSLAAAGVEGGEGGGWLRVDDGTDSPHRKHIIFSGTKVLQHADSDESATPEDGTGDSGSSGNATIWKDLPAPPDGGCPCVVLRTGFETSQGQLMKTILFATERISAGSDAETGLFIFILLVFAAVASAFVLQEGLADETRNPFKLVLHCIMILTSVIPPELPIELSLAVINSLTALTQSLIFCTEPFRIPWAGKVDVCCFDKTGTLTSDNLVMKGVAGAPGGPTAAKTTAMDKGNGKGGSDTNGNDAGHQRTDKPSAPAKLAAPAGALGEVPTRILAGCHSLVSLNGTLVGDSVEVSTLKGLGWACLRGGIVVPRATARAARSATQAGAAGAADAALLPIQIVRSWQFDPSLRRMCTAIKLVCSSAEAGGGGGSASLNASLKRTDGNSEGNSSGAYNIPPFHDRVWIVAKGAPESLEPLLTDAPANYRSTFLYHMGQGSRVLAMAYRALDPRIDVDGCRKMTRAAAEKGLRFGGFLILGCPMKPDAPYVVRELRESSHAVAMITGDSVLTAAHVARQVGMVDQPSSRTLVLVDIEGKSGTKSDGVGGEVAGTIQGSTLRTSTRATTQAESSLWWIPLTAGYEGSGGGDDSANGGNGSGDEPDKSENVPFDPRTLGLLAERHALCVTGDALTRVSGEPETVGGAAAADQPLIRKTSAIGGSSGGLCNTTSATAGRVSYGHPSSPLSALCSHVTVFARVSPAQKEQVIGELNAAGRTTLMCGDGTNDVGALRLAHVGVSIINSPELEKRLEGYLNEDSGNAAEVGGVKKSQRASEARRSRMLATREKEEQEMDPALVKLGDASIASPFTAKTTSVGCVLAVIRQGRCTLVTTLQVYKILALNCLTSAYMLSALYLKGVKQGDGQMTVLGLAISTLFYCASRSRPMRRLSAARPPARIFCLQTCFSVLGQFFAHLLSLFAVTTLCEEHVNPEDPSVMPDGPFRPNTFNSAVFLLSSVMQVNTFAANYTGHPFMQSLRENRPMWWLIVGSYAALVLASSGLLPAFESWLQLAPFPEGFRGPFLVVLAADTFLVFLVESSSSWFARETHVKSGAKAGRGVRRKGVETKRRKH